MRLHLTGINHNTAPVTIREKAAISGENLAEALALLSSYIPRGVILSTCHRTEIYTVIDGEGDSAEKAVLAFLKDRLELSEIELLRYAYSADNSEAARHLFRVASGLESMIVGEYEVLGQVGQALEIADNAGMVNLPLCHTFQSAIRTGRLVREQTGISRKALSVSSVAVELAAGKVSELKNCKMLVIGAGEAGRLVGRVARERGVAQIVIASRTKEKAQTLATALHGIARKMSDLDEELDTVDIMVTCAGAPHRILSTDRIERVMRQRPETPLVIIDIGNPRNVEPETGKIKNVFLYNIDDLAGIAERNRQERESEIQQAEQIVADEAEKFHTWWHDLEIRPIVGALMSRAEKIRTAQLDKTLKKLTPLSEEQRESVEAMTRAIVTRILKDPINFIKTNGNGHHAEIVEELFNLKVERPE